MSGVRVWCAVISGQASTLNLFAGISCRLTGKHGLITLKDNAVCQRSDTENDYEALL